MSSIAFNSVQPYEISSSKSEPFMPVQTLKRPSPQEINSFIDSTVKSLNFNPKLDIPVENKSQNPIKLSTFLTTLKTNKKLLMLSNVDLLAVSRNLKIIADYPLDGAAAQQVQSAVKAINNLVK